MKEIKKETLKDFMEFYTNKDFENLSDETYAKLSAFLTEEADRFYKNPIKSLLIDFFGYIFEGIYWFFVGILAGVGLILSAPYHLFKPFITIYKNLKILAFIIKHKKELKESA